MISCLHVLQSVSPAVGGVVESVKQLNAFYRQQSGDSSSGDSSSADNLSGDNSSGENPAIRLEIASIDPPSAGYLDYPGCKVYPLRLKGYDKFFPISLLRWLRCNAHNYDIFVVDGIWGFHLFVVWLVLHHRHRPYLVFPHGMLDPWFKRRFPLKHLKKWFAWPWAMYVPLRDARAVIFTCEKERQLARQSFWLYRCNEVVVPFGTQGIPDPRQDYTAAYLERHSPVRERRCLLFLGRVHPKKGPDLLFHALQALQREGLWDPEQHLLVMAGPCANEYAQTLQRLADQLGISASIYWTGMLQGPEKWGAFQSAEAFVLPSHQENYGIAVVEALSASTPVLITHAINISPEIVADGAGLVEHDTVEGIFTLVSRWLQLDAATRQAMRGQARRCFERRYTIKGYAEALQSTIRMFV
jgi:glycosyltransferase involved in cell wall biosynthesis